MSDTPVALPRWNSCLLAAFLAGVLLMLIALLATGPLTVVAVQQRVIPPPAFTVRLGNAEIVAPCPGKIQCDESTPYFGVWWGRAQRDGSVNYRQVFFMYREPVNRR